MTVNFIRDLMDRILPCPPNPEPAPGSTRWYLWQATLHNSGRQKPQRIVSVRKYRETTANGWPMQQPCLRGNGYCPEGCCGPVEETIISVQCDSRGHGVRVL